MISYRITQLLVDHRGGESSSGQGGHCANVDSPLKSISSMSSHLILVNKLMTSLSPSGNRITFFRNVSNARPEPDLKFFGVKLEKLIATVIVICDVALHPTLTSTQC